MRCSHLFSIFWLTILWSCSAGWRTTRIRVLRTDEEKIRHLNNSKLVRENLFFGLRPVLFVSRYSCNCPNTPDLTTPGGPASANFDVPDLPAEDEVIPPADQPPPPFFEQTSHVTTPAPAAESASHKLIHDTTSSQFTSHPFSTRFS